MLEAGLVKEVKRLRAQGCHKGMVSMQGLGYKDSRILDDILKNITAGGWL